MREFFFQIVLFLAGAIIGIAVPLLQKPGQKLAAGILAFLLIVTSLLWVGYELGIRDTAPKDAAGTAPDDTVSADPTVYDNFNNSEFDGKWNAVLWTYGYSSEGPTTVEQKNGTLMLSRQSPGYGGLDHNPVKISEIEFVEARLMVDNNIEASAGGVHIGMSGQVNTDWWWLNCNITGEAGDSAATAGCYAIDYSTGNFPVEYHSWHKLRFEINPDTAIISFFLDGQQIGNYTHKNPDVFRKSELPIELGVWSEDGGFVTGYIDDVRIGYVGW